MNAQVDERSLYKIDHYFLCIAVEITAIVGIAKVGSPLGRAGGVPMTVDFARRRPGPHETSIRNRSTHVAAAPKMKAS
jgi:hypothetical protein